MDAKPARWKRLFEEMLKQTPWRLNGIPSPVTDEEEEEEEFPAGASDEVFVTDDSEEIHHEVDERRSKPKPSDALPKKMPKSKPQHSRRPPPPVLLKLDEQKSVTETACGFVENTMLRAVELVPTDDGTGVVTTENAMRKRYRTYGRRCR